MNRNNRPNLFSSDIPFTTNRNPHNREGSFLSNILGTNESNSDKSGVDVERFDINPKSLLNEFLCLICKDVCRDVIECVNCNSLFCKQCIDRAKNSNRWLYSLSNNNPCPNRCGVNINDQNFKPPSRKIINFLNSMMVKCKESECNVKVLYENLTNHEELCIHKKLSCHNQCCNKNFARTEGILIDD